MEFKKSANSDQFGVFPSSSHRGSTDYKYGKHELDEYLCAVEQNNTSW